MPTEIQVAPALGHGLLATQRGIGETPGYDAIDFRRMIQGLHGDRQGVLDAGGWKVTERAAATSMNVDVAAQIGLARVNGASVAAQGGYVVAPHATAITLDVPASSATNPRVDSVYLTVRDGAHDGSGFTDARVVLLAGTATAGATLDNRNGAPGAPTSSVRLADVLVGANASFVSNVSIRSYRPLIVSGREVGDLFYWPADGNPPGCVQANGGALNRLVFSELLAVISNQFGSDDALTFKVPTLMGGRALVGKGDAFAFKGSGGATTHALAEGELAAHAHPIAVKKGGTPGNIAVWGGEPAQNDGIVSPAEGSVGVQQAGGGQSHNNMPPYLALWPAIFTGVA